MKLSLLLEGIARVPPEEDVEISYLSEDSRDIEKNTLFFARKGFRTDGNAFVKTAVEKGAVAVITDSEETLHRLRNLKIHAFRVTDVVKAEAEIASRFYGNPSLRLKILGITGTNGKTTTTFLIAGALERLGERAGIVGTLGYGYMGSLVPGTNTTPSPLTFYRLLKKFEEEDTRWVVVEVSSHALALSRVENVVFSGCAFTNLSRDHLDFHKDMWEYFLSKERLFFKTKGKGVVNADDPYCRVILGLRGIFPCGISSFGKSGIFRITGIYGEGGGIKVSIEFNRKTYTIKSRLKGEINAYNIATAFSLLTEMGFKPEDLEDAFRDVTVPGRLQEIVPGVFVDYAHTPSALEGAIKALKRPGGRLITVFGCGGNRDREKRPLMGQIAVSLSDIVIITSDNPRYEDPKKIIEDILSRIKERDKVIVVEERKTAIEEALKIKGENDTVLIAGKGHENYQEIKGKKVPFNDAEVVRRFYGCKGDSEDNGGETFGIG